MRGTESIIVISDDDNDDDDDDDAVVVEKEDQRIYIKQCLKTHKRKKSAGESEEEEEEDDDDDDDDVICIENRAVKCGNIVNVLLEKKTISGSDEDCCILSGDPDSTVQVPYHVDNEGEDIVVIAERGPVACRDYPHARHLCARFPFKSTSHEKHCEQCHCYVCDVLAPCLLWGQGKQTTDHCHAYEKDSKWKMMRDQARNPPGKLAGKPRAIQPSPYIPSAGLNNNSISYSYQSAFHSSLNQWAANLNIPPSTQVRSHVRIATTSVLPNIPPRPMGPFNGSTFIQAPTGKVRFRSSCIRPNTVILNRPSGMTNSVPGLVHQSATFHSTIKSRGALNLAMSEKSRNMSEASHDECSGSFLPPSVSITDNLLALEALVGDGVLRQTSDQPVVAQRSDVNGVDCTQVASLNSGELATSDSLRISSSRLNNVEAQPIRNLDSSRADRADIHTGTTNSSFTSISVDSNRAEGQAAQVENNADSLGISDLFGVGSAEAVLDEIFADFGDEFPYLWDDMP